ncbi:MAG: hypothetical protein KJ818_02375 [Candidatus Omnitrophica bacterium]|nr:hypothetical protein [Candidatus Omnitrophota bacterium]
MRQKYLLVILCLIVSLSFGVRAFAGDDEEENKSITAKAADGLIGSIPELAEDLITVRNMTPEQKVDYIITKAEERVKEKISEKFQDDMKNLAIDYAKKSFRAKAFMDIAVPQIRHAVSMGEEFNWSILDKRVQEQADNNFKAIMTAIDTVKFTYGVYQTASEKGALEAFKEVSAKVYDSLATAYIPGWGYFKIGVSLVEGLGNSVMSYILDESVAGMLQAMYQYESDPKGLAQWLYDKSPGDIDRDMNKKWEMLSSNFRYPGAWGEEGPRKAKQMIKDALMGMRMQIVTKVKEEERKQQELQRQAEEVLKPAKDAQKKIEELGARVKQEALGPLSKIQDFKQRVNKYRIEENNKKIQEAEEALAKKIAADAKAAMKYTPIDKATIIGALELALQEISDSGTNGFNREKLEYDYKQYQKTRADLIAEVSNKIAQQVEQANKTIKQIDDQYRPQENAASARYQNARNEGERNSALAELKGLQDARSNAVRPYLNAQYILGGQQALDLQVLAAEEKKVVLEARDRAAKRTETISKGLDELKAKMEKAVLEFNQNKAILDQEMTAKLKYPQSWRNPGYYKRILDYSIYIQQPSDFAKQLRYFEEVRNNLTSDQGNISELFRKEKDLYEKYITTAKEVVSAYKNLVPELLVPKEVGGRIKEGKDTGHETVEYVLQAPWGFYTPIGQFIPDMRGNYIQIRRLWYPYKSFDEQLTEIKKPPVPDISQALSEAKKRVEESQDLAHLGELTSFYFAVNEGIFQDPVALKIVETNLDQEKRRATDIFPLEGGGSIMFILPDKSEGANYLKQLKAFWEKNQSAIAKLKALRSRIGNSLDQYFKLSKDYYPTIEKLETTPDRIKLYEANFEQAKKDYNRRVDYAEKYYKEAVAEFNQLMKEQFYSFADKVTQLEKIQKRTKNYLQLYKIWKQNDRLAKIVGDWQKLSDDLAKAIADTEEKGKRSDAERKRQWEEQEQARQEQERKKQEELRKQEEEKKRQEQEARERARTTPGGLAGMYGYSLLNPRLNTFSLNAASGDIIVTPADLKQGSIEITCRLSNMDQVGTILFSEDGGRSWKELNKSQDISYSFIPMPNKLYQPLLKIKTTDNENVELKVFPDNINGVIYKDIDYNQLVAQTIQKIAEAYEGSNFSQFSQYISTGYLGNKTFLEEGIRTDFDLFTGIRLTIYINRIDKRGNIFAAETRWEKTQTPRNTGQEQRTSGNTTFMFVFEDGKMKIQNLRGNLIYATLQPEIAQASGLPQAVVNEIRVANQERNPVQPGAGETEQAGGTSTSQVESGSFNLTQTLGHAAVGWIQEFNFSNNQVYTVDDIGPTYDFRRREGWLEVKTGDGIQDMGATGINSVAEAPAAGYNTTDTPTVGHTYALELADGTYALVYITSLSGALPGTSSFQYKHQKSGSRSFN